MPDLRDSALRTGAARLQQKENQQDEKKEMISYGDKKTPRFQWNDLKRRAAVLLGRINIGLQILTLLLLALFADRVLAGEATLTWTAPTENTDGTPLTDLAGFKIYYGVEQGGPYPNVVDVPNPATTTFVVQNLTEGLTYWFVSTAYNSADPVQESDFSNEVSKLIPFPVPNPPTMLTVQNLTVFDIVKQKDKYILLAVGTVPAGTECNPAQTVNGHYAVPSDIVSWFGNVQPPVVVADCS